MDKQVIISMGDFRQIEKTEKVLDRAFNRLEHVIGEITDEPTLFELEFVFKDLGNGIEALRNVIR